MTEHRLSPSADDPVVEPQFKRSASRLGRVAGIATAAVLFVGGGAFAGGQLGSAGNAGGGADSPAGSVEAMFTSLERNDVIGMLDQLASGERDVLRDATVDYVDELKRLGVLRESLDLGDLPGFDFEFENMTYEVERANARVSLVELTGGQVTLGVDVADLPLGKIIVDRLGPLPEGSTETVTIDVAEALADIDVPARIAVIEESGRYYVSAFYTLAEALAAENRLEMPSTPIPAVGAVSPEDAVRELIEAGLSLDVARAIELTPPDEMAALHDYGQILVELAEEAIVEEGVDEQMEALSISIDALEFETVGVSGGTKLLPTHVAVSVDAGEGDVAFSASKVEQACVEYEFTVTFADVVVDGDASEACAADIYEVFDGHDLPIEIQQIAERMLVQLGQVGIVTVEVDGAWYVSPARSGSDLLLVALQGLEAGDIEILWDWFESELTFT